MRSPITLSPLEAFLKRPNIEASPAWELLEEGPEQKPMPTLFHSRLQRNLVNAINQQTEQYEAIQELRCVVPPLSPVPDISIIAVDRLSEEDGPFQGAPDWLIEIRSPDQSTPKLKIPELQKKILHFVSKGTQLAWLIDIQRQQVWVWQGQELPLIYADVDPLPTLKGIPGFSVASVMAMKKQR